MKNQRILVLAIAVTAVLFVSNILNFTVSTSRFNESYPAVVCPPNTTGLSTAISLSSPKTLARKTGTTSMKFGEVGLRRYAVAAQSAVIESGKLRQLSGKFARGFGQVRHLVALQLRRSGLSELQQTSPQRALYT